MKPRVVTAPERWKPFNDLGVFLAGGITGCPDWQAQLIGMIDRPHFDVNDPAAAPEQIRWEHQHLRAADLIAFWFPAESVCPIALFELGKALGCGWNVLVGTHPAYPRRFDVVEQAALEDPDCQVAVSLQELAGQIIRCSL